MIMLKIMEDFLLETDQKVSKRRQTSEGQRVIGLQMFTRRLMLLNNDKFGIIVKRYSQHHEMFDTIDKEEWNNLQSDMIKANALITRQKSLQVLNDIRSEISSEKLDNQSEYSDYSAVTGQYNFQQ
jgi:hypothetical protein